MQAPPSVAFGCGTCYFAIQDEAKIAALKTCFSTAVADGYRHIDCAQMYQNEKIIGEALQDVFNLGVVTRPELWISSKVTETSGGLTAGKVREAAAQTLQDLKVGYLDLYLVHSFFESDFAEVWAAMEALVDEGLVRRIGVSNCNVAELKQVQAVARIQPYANQIEQNPFCCNPSLVAFCAEHGIVLQSYSPSRCPASLAQDEKAQTFFADLESKYQCSRTQLLLKWNLQRGNSVVVCSTKSLHLKQNLEATQLAALTEEEMGTISEFGQAHKQRVFWGEQAARLDAV